MICTRCKGLVINDEFHYITQWIRVERCLNCGYVKFNEQKVINYDTANQTKDRGTNRMDELELYRARRRSPKCYSYHIQH